MAKTKIAATTKKQKVAKKPKKKNKMTNDFKNLAILERKSFISVLMKPCKECGTPPDPTKGFSWACISVIGDDRTLIPSATFVARYEFLNSEREALYTDEHGKKVVI